MGDLVEFLRDRWRGVVGVALGVAVLVAGLANEPSAIILGLVYGAAYALLGLGIVLVYKGSRVFNFAQAEFGTIAAFTVYLMRPKIGFIPAAVLAILVALGVGLLVERLVVQPLFSAPRVTLLVATAGVALLSIGLQLFIGGATIRNYAPPVSWEAPRLLGIAVPWTQIFVIIVLAGLATGLALFFKTSDLGLAVLAASQEPTATNLSGINVKMISAFTWGLAAVLGGAAGVLVPAITPGGFTPGFVTSNFLIFAFVASVVGGMTSLPGAVLGGVVLGLAQQLTLTYISDIQWVQANLPGSQEIVTFLLLIGVLAVRPAGLLGKEA